MKHLKPRDIVEALLFLVFFTFIFAFAGWLETAPIGISIWMAAGVSAILWILYIVVVCIQRNQEANRPGTLWMVIDGEWVALDGSGRTFPTQKTVDELLEPQNGNN